jgi:cytochrome oxidase Cu insertion factor (SCO1/SenC/PrrC family)
MQVLDPTFYGVVLDEASLTNVKSAYGIYAEKVESETTNANYMMDHSGYTLVIDKVGN